MKQSLFFTKSGQYLCLRSYHVSCRILFLLLCRGLFVVSESFMIDDWEDNHQKLVMAGPSKNDFLYEGVW